MKLVSTNAHRQDIHMHRQHDKDRLRYRFALSLLEKVRRGALCDVGGGAGEFVEYAREMGFSTVLVDGNPNNVEREKKQGQEAIEVDLNEGLSCIPDGSFDVVVCLEVIEHVVKAELLLSELERILKVDGAIILSTPNFSYIVDRIEYLRGNIVREEGYHYRFFTERSLEQLLKDAKLVIAKRNSMGSWIGVNFILSRLTFGLLRLGRYSCPQWLESVFASNFVWLLKKSQ